MHQPDAFKQTNQHALQQLVLHYPLATLIVESASGVLINHVPLLWRDAELHGHVARNNELVAAVTEYDDNALKATAVFHGPEGYISPTDYPEKQATGKVVPTWNYAVVHIQGALMLRKDAAWIKQQVDDLTATQERLSQTGGAPLWSLDDAPDTFASVLLGGITGIALAINSIEGKFKLSQNRPGQDQRGASAGTRQRGKTALADLMDAING